MKITEMTKEPKRITFSDIKPGDVFKVKNDTNYYMKTERCEASYEDPFDGAFMLSYRNTICLSNGKLMATDNNIQVILVDCELIIK